MREGDGLSMYRDWRQLGLWTYGWRSDDPHRVVLISWRNTIIGRYRTVKGVV